MTIPKKDAELFISGVAELDLKKTFECGQCFRWNENADGSYTGVAMGRAATVKKEGDSLAISCSENDSEEAWREYFDLDRDYEAARRAVSIDAYTKTAADFGKGLRILRQDRWETLCSFIISQCNNIPRIKGIIERLCTAYGEPIDWKGNILYTFPAPERVAALSDGQLDCIRCGYRSPYIISAAKAVASGSIELEKLSESRHDKALKELKSIEGVGDKVASCVMLYGLRIPDAFPMDVWMKRAISRQYGKDFDPVVFGENAGIAQQYIFYYERERSKTSNRQ